MDSPTDEGTIALRKSGRIRHGFQWDGLQAWQDIARERLRIVACRIGVCRIGARLFPRGIGVMVGGIAGTALRGGIPAMGGIITGLPAGGKRGNTRCGEPRQLLCPDFWQASIAVTAA
ncbi:MAG TPA: hypothetical protein VNZ58_00520, partial [Thermomicrobiales bacterium]|nr:hypothetical protein [Thermomicrobiales bacterium]